jgi:hypothetical protein
VTLVLSFGASDFIVQVSDRRLTAVSSSGTSHIDNVNKGILVGNRVCFAYTGLAYIDGKSTDRYLADILLKNTVKDFEPWAEHIAENATQSFNKIHYARVYKRHAFIGIGWIQNYGEARLYPFLIRISNFFRVGDINGRAEADDAFTVHVSVFGRVNKRPWGWIATGAHLQEYERKWLVKRLNGCAEKQVGPYPVARLFIETIRRVARRDTTVGKDLLITVIPREAAEQTIVSPNQNQTIQGLSFKDMESAIHDRTVTSFWYLSAESDDLRPFAPTVVWPEFGFSIADIKLIPKSPR